MLIHSIERFINGPTYISRMNSSARGGCYALLVLGKIERGNASDSWILDDDFPASMPASGGAEKYCKIHLNWDDRLVGKGWQLLRYRKIGAMELASPRQFQEVLPMPCLWCK